MGKHKYNKEYYKQYGEKHLRRISLNFSKEKDKDILEAIEQENPDNIQAGVKSLIRKGVLYNEFNKPLIVDGVNVNEAVNDILDKFGVVSPSKVHNGNIEG